LLQLPYSTYSISFLIKKWELTHFAPTLSFRKLYHKKRKNARPLLDIIIQKSPNMAELSPWMPEKAMGDGVSDL
jgi:hypothetical protein